MYSKWSVYSAVAFLSMCINMLLVLSLFFDKDMLSLLKKSSIRKKWVNTKLQFTEFAESYYPFDDRGWGLPCLCCIQNIWYMHNITFLKCKQFWIMEHTRPQGVGLCTCVCNLLIPVVTESSINVTFGQESTNKTIL